MGERSERDGALDIDVGQRDGHSVIDRGTRI